MIILGDLMYIKNGPGEGRMCEVIEILTDKKVRVKVLPAWEWDDRCETNTEINKMVKSLIKPANEGQVVFYRGEIYRVLSKRESSPWAKLENIRTQRIYYDVLPYEYRLIDLEDTSLYK